jgi:MFS family permease
VLVDRQGQEWKATVVKVVEQPVSVRQAFFAPYRRLAAFVENQVRNFAASKDKEVEAKSQAAAATAPATAPAAAQGFDIARFAGIFAAIGLALGALGTALTAAVSGLFQLAWWQIPIVLAAVLLVISGPSMLLAYLKLRRRNLGPLLDANGWAVNARARINIPFGASLTGLAVLPSGSRQQLGDPFAEKGSPWPTVVVLALLAAAALLAWRQLGA